MMQFSKYPSLNAFINLFLTYYKDKQIDRITIDILTNTNNIQFSFIYWYLCYFINLVYLKIDLIMGVSTSLCRPIR